MFASLSLIVGVGPTGCLVLNALREGASRSDEVLQRSLRFVDETGVAALHEQLEEMLSASNRNRLAALGFDLPGLDMGLAPTIQCFVIADHAREKHDTGIYEALRGLPPHFVGINFIGLPILPKDIGVNDLESFRPHLPWKALIPTFMNDPLAGQRSQRDVVATCTRLVQMLAISASGGDADGALLRFQASTDGSPIHFEIGAAFLDLDNSTVADLLQLPVAANLLDKEWKSIKPYESETDFDEGGTHLHALLQPEVLASRLMQNAPFQIKQSPSGWRVQLLPNKIQAPLDQVPRSKWVSVLLKLRDLFDHTRAREWAESIGPSKKAADQEITRCIDEDLAALFSKKRGADRVELWYKKARAILEEPVQFAVPPMSDFDGAVARLKAALLAEPHKLVVWARMLILGLIGSEIARRLMSFFWSDPLPWIGYVLGLGIAWFLGFRFLDNASVGLRVGRRQAQEALPTRYEQMIVEHLHAALDAFRKELIDSLESQIELVHKMAARINKEVADVTSNWNTVDEEEMVHVEPVIPHQFRDALLKSLQLPWESLYAEALNNRVLSPDLPLRGEDALRVIEKTGAFALRVLNESHEQLSVGGLLHFRTKQESDYETRIIQELDRRSRRQMSEVGIVPRWIGPKVVLDRLTSSIETNSPGEHIPSEISFLCCLRIRRIDAVASNGVSEKRARRKEISAGGEI